MTVKKKFEYLEELTYADIAFKAYGDTVEELFVNAALAVTDTMVDMKTVKPEVYITFTVKHPTLEGALFSVLEEIVLLKDSQQLFLTEFDIRIDEQGAMTVIVIGAKGDEIDPEKHGLRHDVKAVTYHEFKVDFKKKPMEAQVILDV